MPFTQENRLLEATTDAGADVLLLDSFSGQEGISRPFRFVLSLMSEVSAGSPGKVKPHDLVGTSMSVRIKLSEPGTGSDSGVRYWSGMCERFVKEDQDDRFGYFTAVIVPWFAFLNYGANCRIFQDKDVTQIIKEVVSEHGYSSFLRLELAKNYTTRDYCVQYRETDLDFLSRLMESEGIYYYFEHTKGKHVMVLADSPSQCPPMPNLSEFKYAPVTGHEATEDTIRSWRVEEEMHSGKWTYRDFHHEAPTKSFEVSDPSPDVAAEGEKFEVYDYPGEYAKKFNKVNSSGSVYLEGEKITRARIEKEETRHTVMSGASIYRVMTSGYRCQVTGGFAEGSYLLTEVRHDANQWPAYGARSSGRNPYKNSFRAIPSSRVFVPAVRPHPGIQGLQTAFVIDESPSGNTEEIWPDKYGRVRVRFHWDRDAKYGCWLRVVQPWAGRSWGHQWIPRVGDEVAVTFLEGDPDCPVVIGGLYNSANMPIFSLPDNKTQSGILTHSSRGGGSSNFNMLRFEDKTGSEEIYTQAEKDQNALIKHNETRTVKNNRTTTIRVDDARTVETGNDTLTVQQGSRTVTVKQDITTTSQSGSVATTAQLGSITITASSNSITINGQTQITLQCGRSTITMTPADISITAPMVLINS
ncbi:MAG TPA: type VI secretion system tip protein TssI/VgrG [Bryobacteraceae bacterium]|nr:type VI secretion system tip protein TssI/VgrG [Bryobacteraceae bacterium]